MLRNVGERPILRVGFIDFLPPLWSRHGPVGRRLQNNPGGLGDTGGDSISPTYVPAVDVTKGDPPEALALPRRNGRQRREQLGGIDYIRTANKHRHETGEWARAAEALRSKEFGIIW